MLCPRSAVTPAMTKILTWWVPPRYARPHRTYNFRTAPDYDVGTILNNQGRTQFQPWGHMPSFLLIFQTFINILCIALQKKIFGGHHYLKHGRLSLSSSFNISVCLFALFIQGKWQNEHQIIFTLLKLNKRNKKIEWSTITPAIQYQRISKFHLYLSPKTFTYKLQNVGKLILFVF